MVLSHDVLSALHNLIQTDNDVSIYPTFFSVDDSRSDAMLDSALQHKMSVQTILKE